MARVSFNFFTIILLSSLLIVSTTQEGNKIVDFSVLDNISKTLFRTELKIHELLQIIKKIALYHHAREHHHKPSLSAQNPALSDPTNGKITKYNEDEKIRPPNQPDNVAPIEEPARKSYRIKFDSDDDIEDNAHSNVNTNINTNTNTNRNTNFRKRPLYTDFMNDM